MSLFGGWNQKGAEDRVSGFMVENSNNIIMLILGLAMLLISINWVIPEDVYSTAVWLDSLALNKIFTEPSYFFTVWPWPELPDMTTNAVALSVGLFVAQIYMSYKQAKSGPWTHGGTSDSLPKLLFSAIIGKRTRAGNRVKEEVNVDTLNWEKLGWTFGWLFLASFDTFTDVGYRIWGRGTGSLLLAIVASTLAYNFGSEWMLVVGFREALSHGVLLINSYRRFRGGEGSSRTSGRGMGHSVPQHGRGSHNQGGHGKNKRGKHGHGNRDNVSIHDKTSDQRPIVPPRGDHAPF